MVVPINNIITVRIREVLYESRCFKMGGCHKTVDACRKSIRKMEKQKRQTRLSRVFDSRRSLVAQIVVVMLRFIFTFRMYQKNT